MKVFYVSLLIGRDYRDGIKIIFLKIIIYVLKIV